jgi:hypothetical protein
MLPFAPPLCFGRGIIYDFGTDSSQRQSRRAFPIASSALFPYMTTRRNSHSS